MASADDVGVPPQAPKHEEKPKAGSLKKAGVSVRKAKMAKGAKSVSTHPPYLQMVSEAIFALKERSGSSQQAIAKYLEGKYKSGLPANFKKMLSLQLKKLSEMGKLTKVKQSFKLADKLKRPVKPKTSITQTKQAVVKPKSSKAKTVKGKKPVKVARTAKLVKPTGVKTIDKKPSNNSVPKKQTNIRASKPVKSPAVKKIRKVTS